MRLRIPIALVLATALSAPAAAEPLSFADAMRRAAGSTDRADLVLSRLEGVRADARTALGEVIPTAHVSLQHTLAPDTPGIDPTSASARVVADIVRAPQIALWRAARTRADAAEETARWDAAGLRYAAAQAYVAALAAGANLAAADSAVATRRASLEQTELLAEAGYAVGAEVSRARLSLVEAETARIEAELALDDALDLLAFVVDADAIAAADLSDPNLAFDPTDVDDGTNASVEALVLERAAVDALVRAQWLGFAPVVSFVGGYRFGAESFRDPRGQSVFAVLTATWDVFDFARYGRLDAARAERDEVDAELRLARRDLDLATSSATRRVDAAVRRLELAETALGLASETRALEAERYAGGDATALDLVTADAEVFRAEVARNLAVLERSAAVIELAYVRGDLEEEWPR